MNDTARPLQVALIGYGFVGKAFHAPLINAVPGLELSVVASRDAAKVHADLPHAQVIADPLEAIRRPEVDLVVIASPNDTHAPLALAALEAGKHVVVDKPFTLDLAQARTLIAAAEKHDRLLSVFQNRRWDSDYLGVKQVIEQGLIGKVTHFESHIDRYRPQVRVRWREQSCVGSGLWYDLAPHLLDQALQLFGKPDRLFVDLGELRPGAQAADYFHALLSYGNRRVVLHASMLAAAESPRYVVHGTRGSYIKYGLDPQEDRLKAGERLPQADWGYDMRDGVVTLSRGDLLAEQPLLNIPGNYPAYYAAVRDAIAGIGENPVPAADAIAVMALIELGLESARLQQALPVV